MSRTANTSFSFPDDEPMIGTTISDNDADEHAKHNTDSCSATDLLRFHYQYDQEIDEHFLPRSFLDETNYYHKHLYHIEFVYMLMDPDEEKRNLLSIKKKRERERKKFYLKRT